MFEEDNIFNIDKNNNETLHDENYAGSNVAYKQINEQYYKRQAVRRLALVIGIPALCLSAISYLWSFLYLFFTVKVFGMTTNEAISLSQNPAAQQIIQIILSCCMFLLPFTISAKCTGVRIDKLIQFEKDRKSKFLPFILVGIGFCSFANISISYASNIFQNFGIEYEVDFGENPTGIFGFILTLISTAIIPALVEEFACRGIVLGLLKKYGESFAIITSSIVFGVMHGNFEQIPFAIIVGLILGYIYVKTKNIWTCVVVHCVNNAVSVIFSYFEGVLTTNLQNTLYIIYLIISMLFSILGILILENGKENYDLEKSEDNFQNKEKFKWFFTSWAIVLFIIFNIIESLAYFVI